MVVTNAKTYDYQPVILIGAGRSGTKIIRDVIATHPDIDAVPFDVNYIWRIGQKIEHDFLDPASLTDKNKAIIRKQLEKQLNSAAILLEKTVSNSLRIPYVQAVYPDAKFIHLIRDGRDVVESVLRQWGESRELSYFFKKLKTFPILHACSYLYEYVINWFNLKLGFKARQDYIWGVRYPGYQKDVQEKSVLEVCAIQWLKCIESSTTMLAHIDQQQCLVIRYEELVNDPSKQLDKVACFLNIDANRFDSSTLNNKNIGKYKKAFSETQLETLMSIINPGLIKLGYVS